MALFIKDVWKALRSNFKHGRTAILVVPTRSYMVELLAYALDDKEMTGMRHINMFHVMVKFLNFDVTVMVQNYHGIQLVERIYEYTMGRRNHDLVLVDCGNIGAAEKRSLQQIMSARMGTFSVMVDA